MKGKLLQEVLQRPLIDFEDAKLEPHFESEEQKKEYEQMLVEIHNCPDRRELIHSKRGAEMAILYVKVWRIPLTTAIEFILTDAEYGASIAP